MNFLKYVVMLTVLLISLDTTFTVSKKVDEKANFIKTKMSEMSLDEKIGQMLMIYDYSKEMNDKLETEIKEVQPGGFIVFGPNFTDYDKTKELIANISSLTEIPMLIAVDEEGGKVQRLKSLKNVNVTDIPDMTTLGKTGSENLAYEVGKIIGTEVSTLGINTVFGPVLDVGPKNSSLSDRLISSDKNIVKKLGVKIGEGIESVNVLQVYKHFPGIGNSTIDSHLDLPLIKATKDELFENELVSFKEAIKSGSSMIMVGHAAYPNVTGSNVPASLSSIIINDILRGELGFKGVVVSDALNMKAVTNNYSEKEIYEMAINAGCDILLMPKDPKKTVKIIKELINENKVTLKQIDESVERILYLKYFKINDFEILDKSYLGTEESKKIVEEIKNYDSN